MVFNDTSTRQGLIQECELWTGLGAAQISGNTTMLQEFTRLLNTNYHKLVTMILESQGDGEFDDPNLDNTSFWPKAYNITAATQYVKLPMTDKILKINRAEISYDGSTWYRLNPFNVGESSDPLDTATIAKNFEKTNPFYAFVGNYFHLFPIPDVSVTGGLKIWATREVDEFTTSDTTQEPGIEEPFHRMIALMASMDWCVGKGKAVKNDLAVMINDYETRLRKFYGYKNEDRDNFVLKPSQEDYN